MKAEPKVMFQVYNANPINISLGKGGSSVLTSHEYKLQTNHKSTDPNLERIGYLYRSLLNRVVLNHQSSGSQTEVRVTLLVRESLPGF